MKNSPETRCAGFDVCSETSARLLELAKVGRTEVLSFFLFVCRSLVEGPGD